MLNEPTTSSGQPSGPFRMHREDMTTGGTVEIRKMDSEMAVTSARVSIFIEMCRAHILTLSTLTSRCGRLRGSSHPLRYHPPLPCVREEGCWPCRHGKRGPASNSFSRWRSSLDRGFGRAAGFRTSCKCGSSGQVRSLCDPDRGLNECLWALQHRFISRWFLPPARTASAVAV